MSARPSRRAGASAPLWRIAAAAGRPTPRGCCRRSCCLLRRANVASFLNNALQPPPRTPSPPHRVAELACRGPSSRREARAGARYPLFASPASASVRRAGAAAACTRRGCTRCERVLSCRRVRRGVDRRVVARRNLLGLLARPRHLQRRRFRAGSSVRGLICGQACSAQALLSSRPTRRADWRRRTRSSPPPRPNCLVRWGWCCSRAS